MMFKLTPLRPSVLLRSLAALAALSLLLPGCEQTGGGAASPGGSHHPLVGSPAPEFDLPAQSGGRRAALGDDGKIRLVDFWATWCGPCRASFPKYEALAKKYEDDLVVIGISEDDEADGIQDFAGETGATFVLAWDAGKRVAGSYRPDSMPTSYIVDKNGLVRYVHLGYREGDEGQIEAQIKSLLE